MKSEIWAVLSAALTALVLVGCQSPGASPPGAGPPSTVMAPAELPTVAVGSVRHFLIDGETEVSTELVASDGDYESWARSDGVYWKSVNVFSPPIEFTIPDDEGQVTIVAGDMNELFPLQVGKSVTVSYEGRSKAGPNGWSGRQRCTVEAQESLIVPAGTFDAYKVVCLQGGNLAQPRRILTYYYAPEVEGMIYRHEKVRGERDETLELLRL